MGSVYAAVDTHTGLRVAVKALSPQLAQAEGFRERFEAEIDSLKTLRHQGIVRLLGYGEQDGVLFYSMELVEGTSLEDELKAGRRFNWREVAHIAIQLCRALKHAHDHGVVHRDIKPANILINQDNRVKLADFGIARLFGNNQLTTAGGVLGTADYMSPEQADGRPITDRCDQYSLGGVMYALLAGRTPFRARSLPEMLQLQRFAQPEPVRRYARDTPEQLERVILQLLSKNPEDRFPNTLVLARHLEAMVRALTRPAEDDFSLQEPEPEVRVQVGDGVDEPLSATRIDPDSDHLEKNVRPASGSPRHSATGSETAFAQTLAADDAGNDRAASHAASDKSSPNSTSHTDDRTGEPPRRATFTTLEEATRQRELEDRGSWIAIASQAAGVVLLLAAMIMAVIYLGQPESADELYAKIQTAAESEDDGEMRSVDDEMSEFIERFPDDRRSAQVRHYQQQVTLARLERRLRRGTILSTAGSAAKLPIERLYIRAMNLAEIDPEGAVAMLESIIDLYLPTTNAGEMPPVESRSDSSDESKRQADCLQLAKKRLADLREEIANRAAEQLPDLQEQLAAADAMSAHSPQRAQAMYRAIIALYESHRWASDVVDEARQRLAN